MLRFFLCGTNNDYVLKGESSFFFCSKILLNVEARHEEEERKTKKRVLLLKSTNSFHKKIIFIFFFFSFATTKPSKKRNQNQSSLPRRTNTHTRQTRTRWNAAHPRRPSFALSMVVALVRVFFLCALAGLSLSD